MQHFDDAYSYWATANRLVWSADQNLTNWNIGNNMAKYQYQGELNFRVEDVENGFILSLGSGYNNGGASRRFVFNSITELNDFIAKTNEEELA